MTTLCNAMRTRMRTQLRERIRGQLGARPGDNGGVKVLGRIGKHEFVILFRHDRLTRLDRLRVLLRARVGEELQKVTQLDWLERGVVKVHHNCDGELTPPAVVDLVGRHVDVAHRHVEALVQAKRDALDEIAEVLVFLTIGERARGRGGQQR